MTLALISAALRRRPFTLLYAALLLAAFASLIGAPVPLALVAWFAASIAALELWHAAEPTILWRLGCCAPTHAERERIEASLGCVHLEVLVLDSPRLWLGRGLRCLVITRAALEVLEDRALVGVLYQAAAPARCAAVAGQVVVSIGLLPILSASAASTGLALLGRLLALVVGNALVIPLLLWPEGFIRWAGRAFGALIVGLVGSVLLSSGLAAAGAALLLAWAIVPGLRALLAWEARRTERAADQATIAAGFGWELLEGLDTFALAEPMSAPSGLLGVLAPAGAPLPVRAERIRRALSATSAT